MKNNNRPQTSFHSSARGEQPGFPHGHRNGAKVAAIIIMQREEDGRYGLLMVKRRNSSGSRTWWEVPGGSMEWRDMSQPLRAVQREVMEEAGLYCEPHFNMHIPYKTAAGRSVEYFWCEVFSGQQPVNTSPEEHLDVDIVTYDEFEFVEKEGVTRAYVDGVEVEVPLMVLRGMNPDHKLQPEQSPSAP